MPQVSSPEPTCCHADDCAGHRALASSGNLADEPSIGLCESFYANLRNFGRLNRSRAANGRPGARRVRVADHFGLSTEKPFGGQDIGCRGSRNLPKALRHSPRLGGPSSTGYQEAEPAAC